MKLLLSYDDRVRPDSTAIYFRKAFESILGKENVAHLYPEQLSIVSTAYDFYLKIDDGLEQNRWNPKLYPSGYYVIDCHIDLEWRQKLSREANFDFLFFAQKKAMAADWPCEKKYWVPLGADADFHYVGSRPKQYDVCFIGNFHSQYAKKRIDLCHSLFREFPNFYFGRRTFKDMAEKFAQSKIVWNYALNGDINMRFFEAMMSGSAILTDRLPEMEELGFLEGLHYIGYSDEMEMIKKAAYYTAKEGERETIAQNGFNLVKRDHQYRNRCEKILEIIVEEKPCLINK